MGGGAVEKSMRVSYRWSSGLAVGLFALGEFVLTGRRLPPPTGGWDPCSLIAQQPILVRLSSLTCVITVPIVLIQGLRNRRAWPWAAAAGLVSLWPLATASLWRLRHCYTPLSEVGFWTCYAGIGLMCLHHVIQRP